MFKFKKKETIETKEDGQVKLNNKLIEQIEGLQYATEGLKAQLFKIKNPNGKLEFEYPNFLTPYTKRYITFTYSDDRKIHTVNIIPSLISFSYYKVQINDDRAYIGIKYPKVKDGNEKYKDEYYIVDMARKIAISVNEKELDDFNTIKWTESK